MTSVVAFRIGITFPCASKQGAAWEHMYGGFDNGWMGGGWDRAGSAVCTGELVATELWCLNGLKEPPMAACKAIFRPGPEALTLSPAWVCASCNSVPPRC